jgi:Flp pilus assembly protein TadG
MGLTGAAVDYGHASFVKNEMQTALDATALALSQSAATMTTAQMQTFATNYFDAQFQVPDASSVTITPSYSTGAGSTIVLTASASVPNYVMSLMGYDSTAVGASSTVKWGSTKLRVALVLDNTGSMADSGKMAALQAATKNLLSQLQSAATNPGDVYVSIVPFVKDVNVGSSNYNANWIYWGTTSGASPQDPSKTDNSSWDALIGSCSISGDSSRSSCLSDHVCSKSQYSSQNSCTSHSGTWTVGVWTPKTHNSTNWNGCVMDRGYPMTPSYLGVNNKGPDTTGNYDTNVSAPSTSVMSSLFAAEQYSDCPSAAVMGLNYNWSTMNTLVTNMSPNGNTNQAIGLQLGWMSLTGGGPFTVPAMDPNYTYSQVIILLTDGLNTQDRWYSVQSDIDARQTLTCSNIKQGGVTLYTVQVSTDGTPISTLLQNCASSSTKFFYLTSSSQIVTTFNTIGTNLSNLYVAK